MRVLVPDAQFADPGEIERAVATGIDFSVHRPGRQEDVPGAEWASCDGIICYHEVAIDAAWLARFDRCRIIVRAGVGYDNIDLREAGRRGIAVCNVPDYGTTDVADHVIAMMLTLTRGTAQYDRDLRNDPEAGWRFGAPPLLRRLRGAVFGVVGLGRIGLAAATRARAFGMRVVFHDPYAPGGYDLATGFERMSTLRELMALSDVVSLHTPLDEGTRGLIGAEALAAAKRGLILVNTARGAVVDLDALHAALGQGRVAGAALDVLPVEPIDAGHPLIRAWREQEPWIAGRVLLSPHAAFYCPESIADLRRKSAEVAAAGLIEGRLVNCVNRPWLQEGRGWRTAW